MTFPVTNEHPLLVVEALHRVLGVHCELTFSQYKYEPQSPFDERCSFAVSARSVNRCWLDGELARLKPEWDLAWHSVIRTSKGKTLHVPMIDFTTKSLKREELYLLRQILGKRTAGSLRFFRSGRSYHGYSTQLLGPKGWREFMGKLLLLNLPNRPPLIDARWVGHRIIAGYGSLRWSANSPHYLQIPRLYRTVA